MKYLFTLLLLGTILNLQAQNYAISSIHDSLLTNADAVKRVEEYHVKVKSLNNIIIQHKWAITVLNAAGERFNGYEALYNKFIGQPDIAGTLYDSNGKVIRTLKKKELIDHAAVDGITLASDDRVVIHNFEYSRYPYTVEYEEEQQLKESFSLPHWIPVPGYKFSVQQSKLVVEVPSQYKLRFKEVNFSKRILKTADNSVYTWELSNHKAVEDEPFSEVPGKKFPIVVIAPSDFQVGEYNGNMNDWLQYGKFIATLNQGRDVIPPSTKTEIHNLTDDIKDPYQKVKILYEYLQNTTHYTLTKFGVGGWQPYDASYVSQKKYGDCKALSNYMVAMLKEVGIKANYVLVSSGNYYDNLWEDFPANRFDHAIACVPLNKDTLWLECTSQTEAAGYMGSFTGNRKVLLIDEDGGHVVATPAYNAKDNQQLRRIKASIDSAGNLNADVNTYYTGIQQEGPNSIYYENSKAAKDQYLNHLIPFPTYTVQTSDYVVKKSIIPAINEHIVLSAPDYASVSGKRLFIDPNLFNKSSIKLNHDNDRRYPVCSRIPYIDKDSIAIKVPYGYSIESLPKDVSINSKFGTYHLAYKFVNSDIYFYREFSPVAKDFPPEDYTQFAEFYNKIYELDRGRIILIKKES